MRVAGCRGAGIAVRNSLNHFTETYVAYHNSVRPHSGLDNAVVGHEKPMLEAVEEKDGVICESWLGGLLRHYRRAAA